MPPDSGHALLGPSKAERWIACPASIAMEKGCPEPPESPWATEGTAAHEIAAHKLARITGQISQRAYTGRVNKTARAFDLTDEQRGDMERHADAYAWHIRGWLDERGTGAVLIEQRVDPGVPDGSGTADAIVLCGDVLHVIDYKYGRSVVEVEGNPQLKLYALGALESFDLLGEIVEFHATIYQPRAGNIATSSYTPEEQIGRAHV